MLLRCGGGARNLLLLPLVPIDNRCMYMTHVCFYVCCSDCVGVCEKVCCVASVLKDSDCFKPWTIEVCCMFL